ncbi:hypothetical protein [Actinomadura atramentaria]|uniref:hypothetical protein n=1 Tax=Actinomadura atramentaria TaxID=1990 RepID=UPI0003820EE5|nr:hypothetical protein [Actinomadura atramentaria]
MEYTRTEIDGVPVFWGDGGDEYRVALIFRVGHADETLARSGVTHLIEHLALHEVSDGEHRCNGMVDAVLTQFVMTGSASDTARFLGSVCEALGDLPMDRLETEKTILRTEDAARSPNAAARMLGWRYGAASYGLAAFTGLGLGALAPADLRDWAARWFTRDNAVLVVLGGPPPDGLRLPLPPGERRPLPAARDVLEHAPAYFHAGVGGVAVSGVVPRSPAGVLYETVLDRRLRRVLRRDGGVSYTIEVEYAPRDAAAAHVAAYADGLRESQEKLIALFLGELDRIATEPPDDAELAEAVAAWRTRLDTPDARAARPASAAVSELMGTPIRTLDETLDEYAAVKPEDVRAIGRALFDSALLMLPGDREPGDGRFSYADPAGRAVAGRVLPHVEDKMQHLVIGADGVTRLQGTTIVTVPFASVAAVLAWPDGARQLIGADATVVAVEPNRWAGGESLADEIDRAVPAELIVPMPERAADVVPARPDGPPPELPAPRPDRPPSPLARVLRRAPRALPPAWTHAELARTLPAVRRGDLRAALGLLAATRADAEVRALAADRLANAAIGRGDALEAMTADAPDDPDLHLLLGAVRIAEGWSIRSAYRAKYVSDDQFAGLFRHLLTAGPPLYRAAELLPADPTPWVQLQSHALGLQLGRDESDRLWTELVARAPGLYAGHWRRAQVLCAKWQGSNAEVLAFGVDAAGRAEPGDPLAAMLPIAHLENCEDPFEYMASPEVHAELCAASDRLLSAESGHLRAVEAHHLFGGALYFAGDWKRAHEHLRRTGRTEPPDLAWAYRAFPERRYLKARREVAKN